MTWVETEPRFRWELELARAQGATQMFAALFIRTLEDARLVLLEQEAQGPQSDHTPGSLLKWAQSMQLEMKHRSMRAAAIKALGASGWLTNTHPGFALGQMSAPYYPHNVNEIVEKFEAFCDRYAAGEEPWVRPRVDSDEFVAHWLQLHFDSESKSPALLRALRMALNDAGMERLSQGHPGSDGEVWSPEVGRLEVALKNSLGEVFGRSVSDIKAHTWAGLPEEEQNRLLQRQAELKAEGMYGTPKEAWDEELADLGDYAGFIVAFRHAPDDVDEEGPRFAIDPGAPFHTALMSATVTPKLSVDFISYTIELSTEE